jgi:hypothetical protein
MPSLFPQVTSSFSTSSGLRLSLGFYVRTTKLLLRGEKMMSASVEELLKAAPRRPVLSFAKTLSAFEISGIEIALHRALGISAIHVPSHSNRFYINSSPLPHSSQPVA